LASLHEEEVERGDVGTVAFDLRLVIDDDDDEVVVEAVVLLVLVAALRVVVDLLEPLTLLPLLTLLPVLCKVRSLRLLLVSRRLLPVSFDAAVLLLVRLIVGVSLSRRRVCISRRLFGSLFGVFLLVVVFGDVMGLSSW